MDEFEELVKEVRKGKKNRIIHNASKSHALVLFQNLIEEAKLTGEEIKIVSGTLEPTFYDKLTGTLKECLDAGVKCKVIVAQNIEASSNEFAKIVTSHINGELMMSPDFSVEGPHFIVVGNNKYRFEIDDNRSKAVANFNDDTVGGTLVNVFSDLQNLHKKQAQA